MKEGISKHLTLLAVELYEISEKFIYELREKQHQSQDMFDYLPEHTINKNKTANNQPIQAKYYHQFVGSLKPQDDGEKYLYFRVMTHDSLLDHEISESGIEDLFAKLDFEKLLSVFPKEPQENLTNFVFPTTHYLVVELTYITSYDHYSGGYDCDMEIDVVGYLDNYLNKKDFKMAHIIRDVTVLDMGHYGFTTYYCSECHHELENVLIKKCPKCKVNFNEPSKFKMSGNWGGSDF